MGERFRHPWLSRLLYWFTLLVACGLGLLVLLAPLLPTDEFRVLMMFAQDGAVRRTALASAAGLAVTSFVFFRPGATSGKKNKLRRPPPGTMAGA